MTPPALRDPDPLLLPWLTRRIAERDLPRIAEAAVACCGLRWYAEWPVITDAVAEVIAARVGDARLLFALADILPPIAGRLGGADIDWTRARPDVVGYAALAGVEPPRRYGRPARWLDLLVWANARRVPPLSHFGAMVVLASDDPGRLRELPDAGVAYLFPFLRVRPSDAEARVLDAIREAVDDGWEWYAAALVARVLPYLGDAARRLLGGILRYLPEGPWQTHLAGMVATVRDPWASAEAELAAAHPASARLDEWAARAEPGELESACRAALETLMERYGGETRWDADRTTVEGLPTTGPVGDVIPGEPLGDIRFPHGWSGGPARSADTEKPVRFVNVRVTRAGEEADVWDEPLAPDTPHDLVCNIGEYDPRSLLTPRDAPFPTEHLPGGELDLKAVLSIDGATHVADLTLPDRGDSAWVRLPIPPAPAGTVIRAELAIYYEVAVVYLVGLTLPVGTDDSPSATVLWRLSRSFTDLEKTLGRSTSIVVTGTGPSSTVLVNGLTFAPNGFTVQSRAVDVAATAARHHLHHAYWAADPSPARRLLGPLLSGRAGERESEVSRFDERGAKDLDAFVKDLRILAKLGGRVYGSVFTDLRVREGLSWRLRLEGEARGRPPMVQIVDAAGYESIIPWSIVYDLPLGGTPERYELCPSIRRLDTFGAEPPVRCPFEETHRDGDRWRPDQLCPWGFWGLSTLIEHPPHVDGRDLESVVGTGGPVTYLMADDRRLDAVARRAHATRLKGLLGDALVYRPEVSGGELCAALAEETMDVVYFFCHSGRDYVAPGIGSDPYLQFGEDRVTAMDIGLWARSHWPRSHWAHRHPLVVINGCHTVDMLTESLNNLVRAFTGDASASGVVGTEIAVETHVAAWAMELFLTALRDRSVGEALRITRWTMLGRGNLMGLAYTPYCLANLRLRVGGEAA